MVSRQDQKQERVQKLVDTMRLLLQNSATHWLPILEVLSEPNGLMTVDLYSVFMLKALHTFHLGVLPLLKSILIQYLSCSDANNSSIGPGRKRRKLSALRMSP